MVVTGNNAEQSRGVIRTAITPRFPLHQDKLDVILDDGIRFVWLAQEATTTVFDLVSNICDLVPNNRSEVVISDLTAAFLDGCVQRNNGMSSVILAAGQTHISDHADQAPTRDQHFKNNVAKLFPIHSGSVLSLPDGPFALRNHDTP
jgi:hypothetical protein